MYAEISQPSSICSKVADISRGVALFSGAFTAVAIVGVAIDVLDGMWASYLTNGMYTTFGAAFISANSSVIMGCILTGVAITVISTGLHFVAKCVCEERSYSRLETDSTI